MAPIDRWDHVQRIFLAVADLAPGERAALLEQMCEGNAAVRAEVESLLRADATKETAAAALHTAIKTELASLLDGSGIVGARLGAYRLIREIGRGGMGTVYLASRADEQYESEVAIKLVRPGFDTDFILRRFRRERQILARMHHPNIARLFDGGTAANHIPYLVMEYVQGSRITSYAEEHRLSVEDRLRVFLPVCAAVEYAHRAFIVHRDLKPANILVDRTGTPKLLDFGISKLLHSEPTDSAETQGSRMATPDYASPEQIVGGPVTPAADVYSLGAVLYELLSGARPHRIEQVTPLALERAICHEPTSPPSVAARRNPALSRRLAGDLDTIVLCAMQKEPERRYASAEHLADDLRRHLEHRPVTARPDSPGYRAAKFIRRHTISMALAMVAAVAVAGLGGFAVYEVRASRQRVRQAAASQRALAAAYGRLGELQTGTPEGVRAYSAMLAIARAQWEADPSNARALADYGAAQLGLGIVMPLAHMAEKRDALERARDWLTGAVQRNPANEQLRQQRDLAVAALAALAQGNARP
jgi:eukaryotic-like serine/threonine-protein kinase